MAVSGKYSLLKKLMILLLMLALVFFGYVELTNLNTNGMTYKQKILKTVYPAWMWLSRITGTHAEELSGKEVQPPVSFYSLKGTLNDGTELDFSSLRGKKVLLVNTASDCGYTAQYSDLEKLYEKYNKSLVVIGFPSNDFRQQEKGTDEEIAAFCRQNYGVTFPLMKKSVVIKSDGQNEIFKWLTDPAQNGWNSKQPSWNFCKYLVNEDGMLTNYFGSAVSPFNKDILKAIEK